MSTAASRRLATVVLAAACIVGLTGCGDAVAKTGAPAGETRVLRLGAADAADPELAFFVRTVEEGSHHRIQVRVDPRTYSRETRGGEFRLAGALQAGRVDLGYLPSRDWAQAGAPGFAALQAPGLVTTTAEEVELSHRPVAAQVLGGLGRKGAVGLGLLPSEPPRLLTTAPILTAADLSGRRIRLRGNAGAADVLAALGGTAVPGFIDGVTKDELRRVEIDGVETGPTLASQTSLNLKAPYLASFALAPSFEVLAASATTWRTLPAADRRLLRAAATAAVDHAGTWMPAEQSHQEDLLCLSGAVIVRPSAAALRSILSVAATTRPTDAVDTALIDRIGSAVGAGAARTDASSVPADCPVAGSAATAARLHRAATEPVPSTPETDPPQLVGTYRLDITKADWAAGDLVGGEWTADTTYTYRLLADGTVRETQVPDFPDQGPVHGTWRVKGNRMHFLLGGAGSDGDDFNETVTWSFFKGVLRFEPVDVQDQVSLVIYSVPWRRIG